jgi:hypothetical protein
LSPPARSKITELYRKLPAVLSKSPPASVKSENNILDSQISLTGTSESQPEICDIITQILATPLPTMPPPTVPARVPTPKSKIEATYVLLTYPLISLLTATQEEEEDLERAVWTF